jgi:hypothetical protein
MPQTNPLLERLIGREAEIRQLHAAVRKGQSKLIWGAADAGKTFLVTKMLLELPENERRRCICWSGAASRRQLIESLIGGLYAVGDSFVRMKVHADHFEESTLGRWIGRQSALRLRGILFTAAQRGDYRFFLDHLSRISRAFAQLLQEIINRTKTPVYLTGHGYTQAEIGDAWSLYWTDEYRIRLGPLTDTVARELMEVCIQRFRLASLDLGDFRDDLLRLSGHLPGSIVKMCAMAADPHYHYGDQVKMNLLHVDYLMHGNRFLSSASYLP